MKINKKYSYIIEWIIAVVLLVICLRYSILSYGNFSPLKAHQQSERTYHYGPSKIIKTINLKGGKIYLCRYKDWFSADTVKKGIIRWYPSDQVGGTPIDYSKAVSYNWGISHIKGDVSIMKVYGYVNDPNITAILAEDDAGAEFKYNLDESRMFIFYRTQDKQPHNIHYLKGLNNEGKVVFEEELYVP